MWRRASARCRSCLVLRAAHLACLAAYPAGSWTQWGIGGFSSDNTGLQHDLLDSARRSGVVLFLVIAIMAMQNLRLSVSGKPGPLQLLR